MSSASPRKWRRPEFAKEPSAGEGFGANVRAAIEQIEANLPGAMRGSDPEYLHQLRVGLRRLRSTLRSFRKLVRRRRVDAIDRQLRALLRSLGATRDWDVFCRGDWEPGLRLEAERQRSDARRAAQAVMRSAAFRGAVRATHAWAGGSPWRKHADAAQPLSAFARGALHHLHVRLRKAATGIDWKDADRRHRVRIRVKHMRYGSECFAPAFRKAELRRFLKHLKKLQEILGDLNDIFVQKRLLRKLGRGRGRVAAARAAIERLEVRERLLSRGMRGAWRQFEAQARIWRRAGAARAAGRTPSRGR
jgi:CHAD domain-containing protein